MKLRVVFSIHLKEGTESAFLAAYERIRYLVAQGVEGHLQDQICQSVDDPQDWLVTSQWRSLDDFVRWEQTAEHRELVRPMRECWDAARSRKYLVREETGR